MRKAQRISVAILITLPITVALLITVLPFPLRTSGTLTDLIAISSGEYDTCALRKDGTIVCWGAISDKWEPPQDETFIDILVGWFELCALRRDGSSICWDIWDNVGRVTSQEERTTFGHPGFERFLNRRFTVVGIGESGKCAIRGGRRRCCLLGRRCDISCVRARRRTLHSHQERWSLRLRLRQGRLSNLLGLRSELSSIR